MDYLEKRMNRLSSEIGKAQKKLDEAILINEQQAKRLADYEKQALEIRAEIKAIGRRMKRRKLNLKNFFKWN